MSTAPFPYTLEDPLDEERQRLKLPLTSPRPMLGLSRMAAPNVSAPPNQPMPQQAPALSTQGSDVPQTPQLGTLSLPQQGATPGTSSRLSMPTPTPRPMLGLPDVPPPDVQPSAVGGQPMPRLGPEPASAIHLDTPPRLPLPNRDDPKYAALQPHGLKRVGLTLATALGGPFAPFAAQALEAPRLAYNRDVANVKNQLGLEDTEQQIRERERKANQPQRPENIDQEYADAVTDAINRGVDPANDPQVQQIGAAVRGLKGGPTNDFELWRQQNPQAPVADWLKLQNNAKPQKLTNPFEAFAYGTPQEKQAAQDFINFEKKIGQRDEKPGEVEQRYSLYQRDPEAYKAMFGDRGAAQSQAQATRMLNYFDKRRKEISSDWTLEEAEKAKQLGELDQLAQPYLDAAGPGQGGDRVIVIHPNGTKGTIPRSQLKGAQGKGYQLAQ